MRRFLKAIKQGNEEEVSRLLDADPTLVEKEGSCGVRPLAIAAEARQLGMVKLLVQRGADINASGRWGVTALHHAARGGLKDMGAFLLSKGAQARCKDMVGETPLRYAFVMGQAGVMKMLLPHMGLQGLEERIKMKWTPLMEACGEGKVGLVREIVQHVEGQELEETDKMGRTALHWAALEGHDEVVAILLDKGAQAGIVDDDDDTPLMKAAYRGHLGVVQLIVQHTGGQGLDATNDDGQTALQRAVQGGHEAVVAFLLRQGAQAINADTYDMTPFMSACSEGHVGMAQLLLELQGGQGLDRRDGMGKTALHWAVRGGHAEVAVWLLRNGAGASIRDEDGRTPLMEVGLCGRLGALQILLQEVGEQGLRERDVRWGQTALHWAARCDREEAVQALLLVGADPTIRDNEGKTPRSFADEKGHDECVDVFEWWEGELERRYLLQRAWCIHDAYMTHDEKPTAPMPAFLQDRVAAGQALPEVEMAGGHQEEQPAATSGKRKASSDRQEGQAHQEEEMNAVLEYVVTQLRDAPLFRELMQCFHAPSSGDTAVDVENVNDDDDNEEDDDEEESEEDENEGADMWDDE